MLAPDRLVMPLCAERGRSELDLIDTIGGAVVDELCDAVFASTCRESSDAGSMDAPRTWRV